MRIDELDIDPRMVARLKQDGIEKLYPPQEKAVGPALEGENIVLAIPTASGKSLVAYLAILQAVLRGGKALYIVPLKALASEKYEDLARFENLGIKVGESTGELRRGRREAAHVRHRHRDIGEGRLAPQAQGEVARAAVSRGRGRGASHQRPRQRAHARGHTRQVQDFQSRRPDR